MCLQVKTLRVTVPTTPDFVASVVIPTTLFELIPPLAVAVPTSASYELVVSKNWSVPEAE